MIDKKREDTKMRFTKRSARRLTISEFSRLTGIEKEILRHWNYIGLMRPALRDRETKCFYYVPEQRLAARFIAGYLNRYAL